MVVKQIVKEFCIDKPFLQSCLNAAIKVKKTFTPKPKLNFKDLTCGVKIEDFSRDYHTSIENYWSDHTVNSTPFQTKEESLKYLEWRSEEYPLFHDLMGIWGNHEGETIVDYGCGPGNDTVGFLAHSKAQKIIGIDVSPTALLLASHRLSLHRDSDLNRVRLLRIPEVEQKIPLENESVDYIYSEGVLHHTTYPLGILKEFHRILKKNGTADLMVYNRNSVWMHLYVAYRKKILEKKYLNFNDDEAFARSTDGECCPVARCYRPEEFLALTNYAGFAGSYLGGYFSLEELNWYQKYHLAALEHGSFPKENREFIKALKIDEKGFPTYEGYYAGVGGVYRIQKTIAF